MSTKTITVEMTVSEAWHILRALADSNAKDSQALLVQNNQFNIQERTWIANRILKLVEPLQNQRP